MRKAMLEVEAKMAAPARHTLTIRTGNFQAFARQADREVRPVEEVMGEWLADCANQIRQGEFAETYGDARPSTPAMLCAAAAADERERHPYPDDEQADFARRRAGAGYVEITLAMEGN